MPAPSIFHDERDCLILALMGRGRLILIRGCMFSGKSERLLDRLHAACAAGRTTAAFKHACDDRYAATQIVTHNKRQADAVAIGSAAQIPNLAANADWIGIDEGQFFGDELVDVCRELVARGCEVVVSGLDLDSWGLPFGPMPALATIADEIVQTHSRCARCGATADHTQRLAPIAGLTMVGGPESYEPRCAACFQAPPAELRR